MHEVAIAETPTSVDDGLVKIEAMPARIYHTPMYGEVPVDLPKLERFVKNFNENVRGQEIATNFDHGMDRAKGNKASGWFRKLEIGPSSDDPKQFSLYAYVEPTDEARTELKDDQWKYFSLEWDDEWTNNDGQVIQDVVVGGGFTNRPIAKRTMPINFSESMWQDVDDETKQEMIQQYIETKLKTRLPKASNEQLKAFAETVFDVVNETKEWEHSEPGTGPTPRTDEDGSDDPAIKGGWRRDPLPLDPNDPAAPKAEHNDNEGGDSALTPEELTKLKQILELGSDADVPTILDTAEKKFGEIVQMREAVSASSQEKEFAEKYPAVWKQMQEDRAQLVENKAKAFSESVADVKKMEGEKVVETDEGLSSLAVEKIKEVHKKFAEGTATITDFEETIKVITEGGIVKFGEDGSSRQKEPVQISVDTTQGQANARKAFAEVVASVRNENSELTYEQAIAEAAKRAPDLASAYSATSAG